MFPGNERLGMRFLEQRKRLPGWCLQSVSQMWDTCPQAFCPCIRLQGRGRQLRPTDVRGLGRAQAVLCFLWKERRSGDSHPGIDMYLKKFLKGLETLYSKKKLSERNITKASQPPTDNIYYTAPSTPYSHMRWIPFFSWVLREMSYWKLLYKQF